MNLGPIWHAVTGAMSGWHQGKLFIEHTTNIDHDVLHVIVGVLLWLVFGMFTKGRLWSLKPWLWVLAIISWNETVDLWMEHWPNPGMQYGEGAKDMLLTMFLPTVLLLAVRFRPDLFRAGVGGQRRRR